MIALWHALPPQFEEQLAAVAGLASAYHFDDGYDDVLRAADALEAHGLRGVFFIITKRVDQEGYANGRQLRELVVRGHEVGNHTRTHRRLDAVGANRVRYEVAGGQYDLQERLGVAPRRFAWPYGAHNARADRVVAQFRFTEVRDISDVVRNAARKSAGEVLAIVQGTAEANQ